MPKRVLRRRRGETVLEAFERRIAELDRDAGALAIQAEEVDRHLDQAEQSNAEAESVLAFLRTAEEHGPRATLSVVSEEGPC